MKERIKMRKGLVFGLFFMLLAAMVVITVPTTVTGADLEVGSGKTYGTITAALAIASPNDNIIVYDGTYYENPTVSVSPIDIYSVNGAGNVIIDGGDSGSVFTITVSDVLINGFTIQNSGDSDAGIKIQGAGTIADCAIVNCIITDNEIGIHLDDAGRCTIEYNDINDNSGKGIYLTDCDGSTSNGTDGNIITDNEIYSDETVQSMGIYLENSIYQNILSNDIDDHSEHGIYLIEDSDNNVIENNTIESNIHGMTLISSDNNEIKENVIQDSYYRGIDSNGCVNNKIYHNNFYDNNGATSVYDEDHIQALDDSRNNDWYDTSSSEGNHWSDWTGPDLDKDGIVDSPYILLDENDEDPFPLVDPYSI